jgi:hypothetical protein
LQLFKPRNRTVPKLDNFHGINIAGSIKTFLQQIREPIIPFSYGKDLINAVMNAKTEEIWLVLENLPIVLFSNKMTTSHYIYIRPTWTLYFAYAGISTR